jgi:enoyl-CoA hydratase/carnithine racemase
VSEQSRRAGGDIRFRTGDGAAILGLNRPAKRNAVSQPMWEAIREALAEAAADPGVRALVIEGLPGTFCAGADLTAVKNPTGRPPAATARSLRPPTARSGSSPARPWP